ncbi:unnamed protein product [Ambrosiozyma monospora]|uniref:Unnamed protein product n=1 Tax=Ambrosiozyma monospora TaxID=43982 RepID=A0A9W6YUN5_AMBMO|nr:unnamed protein product [Ambrosiozyma monospora]
MSTFTPANTIIELISKLILLPVPLTKTFDHVMIQELDLNVNHVDKGSLHNDISANYKETRFGKAFRRCRYIMTPTGFIIRELALCGISFIPIIGPALVILLKASRAGFLKHYRYFQLKGYSRADIYFMWKTQKHQYFVFGVVIVILELIPFLNILFYFTNTTGAALWAVHMEEQYALGARSQIEYHDHLIKKLSQANKVEENSFEENI